MPDSPLSAEEVAHRTFPLTFRGFDPLEVRTYLSRVADELRLAAKRERELHRRLGEAEHRAAHPVLDEALLAQAVGEETSRVLASAQAAASELRARAEENVARILREAHEEAQRIRAQAEGVLAERSREAEAEAAKIRRAAQADAKGVLERAREDALATRERVEAEARQLVEQAQTARGQVLGDLSRRRRLAQMQVEQLRAGRERLLEAYRVVRSTLEEVSGELDRVESEARLAAEAVGQRMGQRPAGAAASEPAERPIPAEGPEHPLPAPGEGAELPPEARPAAERAPAPPRRPPTPAAAPAGPGRPRSSLRILSRPITGQPTRSLQDVVPALGEGGGTAPPGERRHQSPAAVRSPTGAQPGPAAPPEPPGVVEPAPEVPVPFGGEPPAPPASEPEASAPAAAVAPSTVPAPTPPGPPEPEPPTSSEQAATAASETQDAAAAPPPPAVDELFARIRAGHQNGGSNELQVLAEEAPTNGHDRTAEAPTAPADSAPEPSVTDQDELLLQRRDALLEGVQTRLTRKLKRALQDEQNQVLDRLRSARRMPAAVSLLPSPQEQASPYAAAGLELLEEAVAAAATFASMEEVPNVDVADLAAELSEALARPLRRHLEQGIDRADHEDRDVVVERIGAAYRECKTQRCERLAADAVIAAFSRGTTAALAGGPPLRWVVDDEDGPCPDCDDNALAGPTPSGVAYPTGQLHPPAHAGCRCLLVQTTT